MATESDAADDATAAMAAILGVEER